MLTFTGKRIFLIPGATDVRKSFNGLSGIARELLGATPSSRDLYLFCIRGRNRLKVLVYDESGVWVIANGWTRARLHGRASPTPAASSSIAKKSSLSCFEA